MSETDQTTEVVVTTAETPPETRVAAPVVAASTLADDLAKVRDLVLRAHPDVVPDLIAGGSVDELIASVEPARSAYQRIADRVRGGEGRGVAGSRGGGENVPATLPPSDPATPTLVIQPPPVPAGAATNVLDPSDLQPLSKIARALAQRKTRG